MQSGNLDNVLGHLMFHKALISEDEADRKLDRYLEVAHDFELGVDFAPKDPMDRSMQMVFDLVLSNNFDPWDIDLVSFTDLYLGRMQQSEVNFIVAGKLVFMAWSILKLQSEEVLAQHDQKQQLFCSDWDFEAIDELYDDDPRVRLSSEVPESVDLCEAVRHQSQRPISLVELLDAFEEANHEALRHAEAARQRDLARLRDEHFDPKSHAEDLEKDVEMVWKRILKCGNGPVVIDDIFQGSKEDRVTVFVSLLFLARNNKIALWQEDLPYGQIFLEIKIPWDIGRLEDAPAVAGIPNGPAVM
jgi:segregation and condensation protein A